MADSVPEQDGRPAPRSRRRWIIGALIVVPIIAYGVTYLCCCERMRNGMMNEVLPRWLDDCLIVITPPGSCGLFFPAACMEAFVRGCWRGVMTVSIRTGEAWDLGTCPWGFTRRSSEP